MDKQKSPLFTSKALKVFFISLLVFVILFELQFLFKYIEDITDKGLKTVIILELITFSSLSMLLSALTFSIIIFTAMIFHKHLVFQKALSNLLVFILFGILIWIYAGFIEPTVEIKYRSLLFDIRNMKPYEELKRSDESLFKSHQINLFELYQQKDSLKENIEKKKQEYIVILKEKTSFGYFGITKDDFNNKTFNELLTIYTTKNIPETNNQKTIKMRLAVSIADNLKTDINYRQKHLKLYKNKITNVNMLPLLFFMLSILGAQLGFLLKNIKGIYVIIITFFCPATIWFFIQQLLSVYVREELISDFFTIIFPIVLLTLINILLFFIIKKRMLINN